MSWKDHRRSNLSVQAILNILEEEGVESSKCLVDTGITASDVLNVDMSISDEVEIQVIENALTLLPRRVGYGIQVGKALRITTFGVWGLAILASPRLRDAIKVITRFSDLSFLLSKISLVESRGRAKIIVDMSQLPDSIHNFMFERYLSGSTTFLGEMLKSLEFPELQIELKSADSTYAQELSELIEFDVLAGKKEYAIVMDSKWLDQPLPQADPLTHMHFLKQCQSMLNERQELPDFSRLVRDFIVQTSSYSPKLEQIASFANMSPRSLRRKLEEEGTTFTNVVLETKMNLAKELVVTAGLPIKVVAHQLGYSEPASFSKAYRRWWGLSPGQDRLSVN